MPAEWEPQEAVWLSWPVNPDTWPGKFERIPPKFAEIAAAISRFETVRINLVAAGQAEARRLIESAGADMARVEFFDFKINDSWCRDHGPIFIKNDATGEIAATDWQYNAWGGKYPPFDDDNRIPAQVADALGLRRFAIPMVLEGGSIEVDGTGQLLTTEACLLHPNRNPGLNRGQIEQTLRDYLGINRILWLGDGIAGDDTDGHIDDLTRFTSPGAMVTVYEDNRDDENHAVLLENRERLQTLRTPAGKPFELRHLPMPDPVWDGDQRLPASYANYLLVNGAVLLPVFSQPEKDAEAARVLGECFPDREIVPIECADLVLGLGTLHCISQQQPA